METNKNFVIMLLITLLYLLIYVNSNDIFQNELFRNISSQNIKNKNNSKKIKSEKRKLDYEGRNPISEYIPLKIYLDLYNFNRTIPSNLKVFQETIINSMNTAKETLEKFIIKDCDFVNYRFYNDTLKDIFELETWNTSLFGSKIWTETNEEHNLYIFFNFKELSDENMASSKIVYIDTNKGPLAGTISLNKNLFGSKLKSNYLEALMLHHFTHILGFHKRELIQFSNEEAEEEELDEDEQEYFEGIIKEESNEGKTKYYIDVDSAPKTIQYANEYFGIDNNNINKITEIELELDDYGNIHWPSRLLLGEYMTKFIYPEEQVISKFTLEFLNDLGFIKVEKYYTGGLMRFGKNQGYNFYNKNCLKDGIKFKNDFYYPNSDTDLKSIESSCSSGRLSKTVHKLIKYENSIDEDIYPTFTGEDGIYSGLISVDYCPISVYNTYDLNNNIYIGRCSEENTISNIEKNVFGEKISDNSFCVLNSLVKLPTTGYESYIGKFRAGCFNMYCSSKSLTIQVGEDYLVCPIEGGIIKSENYNGYILCPDYNLICTAKEDKDLCNDMFKCIDKEVEEKEASFDYSSYNSEIKTTQDSSEYKEYIENNDIINDCSELAEEGGKCPKNCMQCKENNRCFICLNNYDLLGQHDEVTTEKIACELTTTLTNGHYYTKEVNSYTVHYPCINKIEHCAKCSNANTCTECEEKYTVDNNNKCKEIVQNCDEYNADKSCKKCKVNYGLVKGEETSCILLTELSSQVSQKYYYTEGSDPQYYVKCSYKIENCEKCEGENNCIKCINNYGIIENDHSQCRDISSNEYYFDSTTQTYKPCSAKINNCKKCSQLNELVDCIECDSNEYSLVHGDTVECILKTTILNDNSNNYFTDDDGINYYSCSDSFYHSVENCLKCNNKETCLSCQNGYLLLNSNNLCLSNSDLKKNKYVLINNVYKACSELMKGCETCTSGDKCTECNISYDLDINDKCIPTALSLTRYYKDPTTGKYISCEEITNCEECSSGTECTKCKSGYELDSTSTCIEKENDKDNDYDKIKALATGAIVLGVIATVVSITAIIFLFFKNILFQKRNSNIVEPTDSVNNKNDEENEVVIQPSKRTIHNQAKNNDNSE